MFTLNCKGKLFYTDRPVVMGIINATPDSFYEGSRAASTDLALQSAEKMLRDGAAFLDIGGQSTRPGAEDDGEDAEIKRVLPVISAIHKQFPEALISIDTYHARVASLAIEAGACMVNDISGGIADEDMLGTVAKYKVPYVCMHMRGTPQTMQGYAKYNNLIEEVTDYFVERIEACRKAGISDLLLDPGFGFAKTPTHNFELLKKLPALQLLGKPLLVGLSRKSTVYKTLGITANEALNGSTVLHSIALLNGASILRVHDVKEANEAIVLTEAYRST